MAIKGVEQPELIQIDESLRLRKFDGVYDFAGLLPEQVQGFGLGVMNARASYFAKQDDRFSAFLTEGRSFGPHGKGLVIANSVEHYDDALSRELTELVETANNSRLSRIFSNKVIRRYPAFEDFHGMEECIDQIAAVSASVLLPEPRGIAKAKSPPVRTAVSIFSMALM